jgi:hypothetical protein
MTHKTLSITGPFSTFAAKPNRWGQTPSILW